MSSSTSGPRADLAARFAAFERVAGSRAPLYARLAPRIAEDDDLLALLDDAPPQQRLPVLLFAAVHLLVIEGRDPDLAAHYPNLAADEVRRSPASASDPFPAFRRTALDHANRIRTIAATSTTQTNEVGRCAWLMPPAAAISAEVGPIALVDVGASAGLNLLMQHFRYEYARADAPPVRLGMAPGMRAPAAAVEIECELRPCGGRSIEPPRQLPEVVSAVGLDAAPVDVHDEDRVRWLEACIWPDMVGRFHRLVAAVALARSMQPRVVTGDAVDDLPGLLAQTAASAHPVVMTSWILNYLDHDRQREFVGVLDAAASDGDLSWIVAESPAETPGLPIPTTSPAEDLTVVSLVRWRGGRRTIERIGTGHPHGYWLQADCTGA